MRIFGIGIDVIEIERVEGAIESFGERFLDRIFTNEEQQYCLKQKRPAVHLAARWSAKEATSKALGTVIGTVLSWKDMEVVRRQTGEPEMILKGDGLVFSRQQGIDQIKISLTHAQNYAAANAVAISNS